MPKVLNGKELETRVYEYIDDHMQGRGQTKQGKKRFIRAAIFMGQEFECHGLIPLGNAAGLKYTVVRDLSSGKAIASPRRPHQLLLDKLIEAKIVDHEYEDVYVPTAGIIMKKHRYVIRLHPDLYKKERIR